MESKTVKCAIISVDCVKSDLNNGCDFLGFDFYVKENEDGEMKDFIINILNLLNIPYINVYNNGFINAKENEVSSRKDIAKVIRENADFLINESLKKSKLK